MSKTHGRKIILNFNGCFNPKLVENKHAKEWKIYHPFV